MKLNHNTKTAFSGILAIKGILRGYFLRADFSIETISLPWATTFLSIITRYSFTYLDVFSFRNAWKLSDIFSPSTIKITRITAEVKKEIGGVLETDVIFYRNPEYSLKPVAEKTVEKTVEKILGLIMTGPKITQRELMDKIGLTRRGIEWNLKKLKTQGRIRRIGPAKGGHWEVSG